MSRDKHLEMLSKEKYQKEVYEGFREWVLKFDEKTFDLESEKIDIFYDFFKRTLNSDYRDAKSLARAILKSYFLVKEEEIAEFIDAENLSIKKPIELTNKFLNDYILEDGIADCKNSNDVYDCIAHVVMDRVEDIFGNRVYLNILNVSDKNNKELKRRLVEEYREKGYTPYAKDARFLIRDGEDRVEIKDEYQPLLIRMYVNTVKDFIMGYGNHINQGVTTAQFNEFWDTVEGYLASVEKRLTEETKQSQEYLKYKMILNRFNAQTKEKIRKTCTKEGRNGDYYTSVKRSLKAVLDKTHTEDDLKVLKDFYRRTDNLKRALTVVDERGKNYPVNYFVCMPIHPINIIDPLAKLQKTGILNEEQIKVVNDVKRLVRQTFPAEYLRNSGDARELGLILSGFKMRTEFCASGRVVDLTSDEAYAKFVEQVQGIIDEHSLPKSEACATMIARDLVRGRNPVNMKGVVTSKNEKALEK